MYSFFDFTPIFTFVPYKLVLYMRNMKNVEYKEQKLYTVFSVAILICPWIEIPVPPPITIPSSKDTYHIYSSIRKV